MIKVSVVVPCRNEAPYIQECIEAIYNSVLEPDVEITTFIVDGMSNDGTRDIVKELATIYPHLVLLDNVHQTTPFAFNLGVKAQNCDFVQRVDARHIISSNYIQNSLNILRSDSSIWGVGGRIFNEYINNTGKIIAQAMGTQLGMGIGNFRTLSKSGFTDTVTSPMYPSWVFDKVGYFDENLIRNQDDDFNYRVTKAGGKIYFDASISLKYYVRGDYNKLWNQFNQYGYWKVYVNKKHKAVTTIRQMVPPLFVLYLILAFSSWLLGGVLGGISNVPLLFYIILVLFTSSRIKKAHSDLDFWAIAKTFPILHISYGLGYLKGMIHFLFLNKQPAEGSKRMTR